MGETQAKSINRFVPPGYHNQQAVRLPFISGKVRTPEHTVSFMHNRATDIYEDLKRKCKSNRRGRRLSHFHLRSVVVVVSFNLPFRISYSIAKDRDRVRMPNAPAQHKSLKADLGPAGYCYLVTISRRKVINVLSLIHSHTTRFLLTPAACMLFLNF